MLAGVFDLNGGALAEPANAVRIARLAEDLGFDSLWIGEHVIVPSPRVPPSPIEPTYPMIDPMVSLAFLAGVTTSIKLATGIVILPQREPVVLAKQVASLDAVSSGRVILGLGVGYLEPEFRAIGVTLEDRGRRATEYLEAMQQLWRASAPAYDGRFVGFSGVDAYPRPVQQPWPPIYIGGRSDAAYRRAQRFGNGWYGWGQDVAATAQCLEDLRAAASTVERPAELGRLEITLTPPKGAEIDAEMAAEYAALGVDRLVVNPPAGVDIEAIEAYVRRHAPEAIGLDRPAR